MTKRPTKPAKGVQTNVIASPVLGEARQAAEAWLKSLRWPPDVNSATRYNPTEVEIMAKLGFIDGYLAGLEATNPATPKGVRR